MLKRLEDKHRVAASTAPRNTRVPGSPEWCYQTMNLLRDSYKDIALDSKRFEECLHELRRHRAWEKVPIEKPYGTEERMLQAEIGKRAEEIATQLQALKLQAAELRGKVAQWGEVGNGRVGGSRVDSVNSTGGGNSIDYTYRRLLRDRPDLAKQVKSGKMSANEAAIEAGFRKKLSRFEQIMKWWPTLTDEQKDEIRRMP